MYKGPEFIPYCKTKIQNAASIPMCRSAVIQSATDALSGERCPAHFPDLVYRFEVVAKLGLLGIATPIVFGAWNKTQLAQFYCT